MWRTLWLKRWQIASALAVAAASLYVRLDRLGSIPSNLTADETDFFRDIYRIIHERRITAVIHWTSALKRLAS